MFLFGQATPWPGGCNWGAPAEPGWGPLLWSHRWQAAGLAGCMASQESWLASSPNQITSPPVLKPSLLMIARPSPTTRSLLRVRRSCNVFCHNDRQRFVVNSNSLVEGIPCGVNPLRSELSTPLIGMVEVRCAGLQAVLFCRVGAPGAMGSILFCFPGTAAEGSLGCVDGLGDRRSDPSVALRIV